MKTIFILFFLFSFSAQAQIFRKDVIVDSVKYMALITQGDQSLKVDLFYEDSEGWPQKLASTSAINMEQAQKKVDQFTSQVIQKKYPVEPRPLKISQTTQTGIWPTREEWSQDWEDRFSDWIRKETGPDFFKQNNIATDCADVAFSLRWIFSRIHFLPVANTLGANNRLMTNESSSSLWNELPTDPNWKKDKRFLKALNYFLDQAYTHTLMKDSYPIALNTKYFKEGVYHLTLHDTSGHTQLIHETNYQNPSRPPFMAIASTTPRAVRTLYANMPFFGKFEKGKSAFLRFRWPAKSTSGQTYLVPPKNHPGFSEEQFSPDFNQSEFSMLLPVYRKLVPSFSLSGAVAHNFQDIESSTLERIDVVSKGWQACQPPNDCQEGSDLYESWSTPSRDQRLKDRLNLTRDFEFAALTNGNKSELLEIQALKKEFLSKTISIPDLGKISFKRIEWNLNRQLFSSNPRVSPAGRWGFGPQGLVDSFEEFLKNKLRARKAKVDESIKKCPQIESCSNDAYENLKTNSIDEEILFAIRSVEGSSSDACLDYPKECQEIQNRARPLEFSFDQRPIKFGSLLENSIHFQFSPGLSHEERWGLKRLPIHKVLKNDSVLDFNSSWIGDSSGKAINLETKQELRFPGWEIKQISSGRMALTQPRSEAYRIAVYDLAQQTQTEFDWLEKVKTIFISTTGAIGLVSDQKIVSLSFQQGQWIEDWKLDLPNSSNSLESYSFSHNVVVVYSDDNIKVRILGDKKTQIDLESSKNASLQCSTGPYCSMTYEDAAKESRSYILGPNTFKYFSKPYRLERLGETFWSVFSKDGSTEIQQLGPDLSFIGTALDLKVDSVEFTSDAMVAHFPGHVNLYTWTGNHFTEQRLFNEKIEYLFFTKDYFLAKKKDRSEIYKRSSGQLLYTTPKGFFSIYQLEDRLLIQNQRGTVSELKEGKMLRLFEVSWIEEVFKSWARVILHGQSVILKL